MNNKNTSLISSFLYFLSKTDTHALQFCTAETRAVQSSIGVIVFITGVMAMVSMFFALETIFFQNPSTIDLIIAGLMSLFYAFAIVIFDREVVSVVVAPSKSKSEGFFDNFINILQHKGPYIPRLVFAIVIGIIIAFPLELKVQEDQISAQITKMIEKLNGPKLQDIRAIENELNSKRDKAINLLREDIQASKQTSKTYLEEFQKECGRGLCGPKAKLIEQKRIVLDLKIEEKMKDFKIQVPIIEATIRNEMKTKLERLTVLESEVAREKLSHDLLTQFRALEEIKKEFPEAATFGLFLSLFFIMFEVFPVVTKMFLPYSEYNAYLDARRRLNINKIIALSNHANSVVQSVISDVDNPNRMESLEDIREQLAKTEITDIFEDVLEDSHHKLCEGTAPSQVDDKNV